MKPLLRTSPLNSVPRTNQHAIQRTIPKTIRRTINRTIHRWLGLSVGALFVFQGLSGSFLIQREWQQASPPVSLHGNLSLSADLSVASWVTQAQKALGYEDSVLPNSIKISRDPARAIGITFSTPTAPTPITVSIDPTTEKILNIERFSDTFSGKIFLLHRELFLGKTGKTILASLGLLLLILLLSGLILLWPKTLKELSSILKPKFPLRALGFHRSVGMYGIALLLISVVTGTYLARSDLFRPALENKGSGTEINSVLEFRHFTQLEQAIRLQSGLLNRPLQIRIDKKTKALTLNSGEKDTLKKFSFDPVNGTLTETPTETLTTQQSIHNLFHRLHEGKYWGGSGSLLTFITGLLPLLFFISGLLIWRRSGNKNWSPQ